MHNLAIVYALYSLMNDTTIILLIDLKISNRSTDVNMYDIIYELLKKLMHNLTSYKTY